MRLNKTKHKKINYNKKNIFETITDIYIFIIIILFPLMVDKTGFFKILELKYKCFITITTVYVFSCTAIAIYFLLKKKNIFKQKKITIIQYLAIIFLILNIISCFASPFFDEYNLFIGVGRGEGLITSILYILSFLYISFFGNFKKKYILYFSISSILVNTIAILQYIGFNPLNMYQDGIGTHNVSFMTTIGNIDFISALYTILLSISFSAYIFLKNTKKEQILHLLSVLMGSFIFQIIDVNSGKVAFAATLIVILPFIFQNNIKLSKFLTLIAIIFLGTAINIFLNIEYHYDLGRLVFNLNFNYIVILFIIIITLLFIIANYLSKSNYEVKLTKKKITSYYITLFILMILGLIVIFFIPFKSGILYEIHELLHLNFDDNFGTYRIFLWKRTIPLIKDYPILGSGPDTFALRFMPLYSEDIASIGPLTINDTAANIYLTMLVNLGFLGTISYIGFLITILYNGIKNKNIYSYIPLIAIFCYIVQSFFNLSVVIVSPIFWSLIGIHHLSICNEKEQKNSIKKGSRSYEK